MSLLSAPSQGTFPIHPKIIFMGTPEYAVASLQALLGAEHEVLAVVTQPDRPKGRSKKPFPSPVKLAALDRRLNLFQPEDASDPGFCGAIRELQPDLFVVVAYGQVLKRRVLEIPPWGGLNIHASLLPKYRGAAPIQWAIINGEEETGLTAMVMEEGLDTGPMLLRKKTPISGNETAGKLHDRLSVLSGELLLESLEKLAKGLLVPRPQDDSGATYAPKIGKRISLIDWMKSAKSLSALIRGLDPFPGAVTSIGEKTVKLFSPRLADSETKKQAPGTVVDCSQKGVLVQTGEGVLEIGELQAPGKKRLPADAFLRGFLLEKGMVLGKR